MYIHKITLTNIRGFRGLEFDLQRPDKSYAGWTVFTGDNGAGKSTLLKAIATARYATMFLEAESATPTDISPLKAPVWYSLMRLTPTFTPNGSAR